MPWPDRDLHPNARKNRRYQKDKRDSAKHIGFMLAKAADLQVYQSLGECDLTNPLDEEPFDAILCAGVFGFGPPFPDDIRHLIAITQPGGLVAITVNGKGWADKDWERKLPEVVAKYALHLEEQFEIDYLSKEDIGGKLLVFRA